LTLMLNQDISTGEQPVLPCHAITDRDTLPSHEDVFK
jgi:hypothetical protein